jgi:hypothetical protein
MTIGFEQALGLEVAADGKKSFGRRVLDGGKAEIAGISAQPDHG